MISTRDLNIQRTKLANQRTYLAYMRTGFVIAAISGTFKQKWIMIFGFVMIIGSVLQYLYLVYSLNSNKKVYTIYFDLVPVVYVILSIGALYLQYQSKHPFI